MAVTDTRAALLQLKKGGGCPESSDIKTQILEPVLHVGSGNDAFIIKEYGNITCYKTVSPGSPTCQPHLIKQVPRRWSHLPTLLLLAVQDHLALTC